MDRAMQIAAVKELCECDHAFLSPEDKAEGCDAADLAFEIARHLKLEPPGYLMGRGSRLRECCKILLKHLES